MRFETAKGGFFDRALVLRATDAAERRNLSRFGAFTRQRARTSIRKRKRVSDAGKPPSSHVGTLRNLILFAFDQRRRSVVIGPTQSGRGEAPALLEYGGDVTRRGRNGATRRERYR